MTLTIQFYTLISMIAMGSYFGAALDTYNRFLQRSKRKRWIVFIHDLLFWLVQGLIIFYVLFLVNQGELRFYLFLALLCGFAAYQALFKKLYMSVLEWMIQFVISLFKLLVKIITILLVRPIIGLIKITYFLTIKILKGLYTLVKLIFRVVLSIIRVVLRPIWWILKIIWKLLPKYVTKRVDRFCKYLAGFYKKLQKTFINRLQWIKNKWKKE
ncbi:spore cortex biosynthesis protein YabQ [Peribacillus alkalitolerans]|uniref:spore cortex biosynthesis protein YabQ n=1 Tax=Peribacillus alkalitolerans TaxID=1550385 RepID=UPI0013D1B920|nr:spore cortex biosynthesis protein YabQ [Peribacillus alkalitolerans]